MDDKNKIGITRLGDTIRVAGIAHLTDFNQDLRAKSLDSLKKGLNNLFPHAANETNDLTFGRALDQVRLMQLLSLGIRHTLIYI